MNERSPLPLQRVLELRSVLLDGLELGPLDREDLEFVLREIVQAREEEAHALDQAIASAAR